MIRMMKLKILYLVMLGFMESNLFASTEIPVVHPSCEYTMQIPEGWDIIPLDTVKSKLAGIEFDSGIYPVCQGHYFNGNYVY